MQAKLASMLTILSVASTAIAAAVVLVGWAAAVFLAVVSALALIASAWAGSPRADVNDGIVAPYLLSIPLLLVLETIRYMSGWVAYLEATHKSLFAARFAIIDANWFVAFVVFPATLMLLGGHFLSKRRPIGHYMAWWTGLYVIAEGLLEFATDSLGGRPFNLYTIPDGLAALSLLLTGLVTCRRLLSDKAAALAREPDTMTARQLNLWSTFFIALVAVYAVTLLRQAGPLPVIVIVGSMLGGLIGWRLTTAKRPADPAWAAPLFLMLLALFYIHVGEEALTDFNRAIASISGTPWSDYEFTLLIGLAGPVVWFFAAWSLWRRQPLGNFIFWFLIVGMILGEPTHLLLFPIVAMQKFGIGYEYFSGMYTALFPMIPAIMALVTIIGEHRRYGRASLS